MIDTKITEDDLQAVRALLDFCDSPFNHGCAIDIGDADTYESRVGNMFSEARMVIARLQRVCDIKNAIAYFDGLYAETEFAGVSTCRDMLRVLRHVAATDVFAKFEEDDSHLYDDIVAVDIPEAWERFEMFCRTVPFPSGLSEQRQRQFFKLQEARATEGEDWIWADEIHGVIRMLTGDEIMIEDQYQGMQDDGRRRRVIFDFHSWETVEEEILED